MIKTESLQAKWIQEASGKLNADRVLTEKVVWALWLLEGLASSSLPFIFKGGTALMLKLGSTRRLSIDIDIVMPLREEGLAEALNKIAKEQGFIRAEEQQRETGSKIPKTHFKFFYRPQFQNAQETYVLLDILFGNAGYQVIKTISIESPFILSDGKATQVQIPSFEDLTGDKLTAFAPNTTGIPYQKNEQSASMEIVKQLYDLGYLFDQISDLETIRKTFASIAKMELGYRNLDISIDEILIDTYETALCLSTRGILGRGNFEELSSGIKKLRPFIYSENYQIEKAIVHVSRVAYLTRLIQSRKNVIERFESPEQVADWNIEDHSLTKLNKLKKGNVEAFYYWLKALNA